MWLLEGDAAGVMLLGRTGRFQTPPDIGGISAVPGLIVVSRADVSRGEESTSAVQLARVLGNALGHVVHAAGLQVVTPQLLVSVTCSIYTASCCRCAV
jgi:hypothetical protein